MIEVTGLTELNRNIDRLNGDVDRIMKDEVRVAGINIETNAKLACPVDTGRLRNSITHEIRGGGYDVAVGSNVEYAPYVEFGTRFMPAQPFLFPAFEQERAQFEPRLIRAINAAARRAAA